MLKPAYCQYCGTSLSDGCDCAAIAAERHAQFIEDYENDPMVQAGWAQQDLIDSYRRER